MLQSPCICEVVFPLPRRRKCHTNRGMKDGDHVFRRYVSDARFVYVDVANNSCFAVRAKWETYAMLKLWANAGQRLRINRTVKCWPIQVARIVTFSSVAASVCGDHSRRIICYNLKCRVLVPLRCVGQIYFVKIERCSCSVNERIHLVQFASACSDIKHPFTEV